MPEYPILNHLSPVRRVVTGHDPARHAIFDRDESLTPVAASTVNPGLGHTLIHRTNGFPVTNVGADDEFSVDNLQRSKHPLGIVCQMVDLPARSEGIEPLRHRNQSMEYGVILSGSVVLELDNGVGKELREGDVFIQRGTQHVWKTSGDGPCRFMTIIIPAEQVIDGAGEALLASKMAGLTE